MMDEIEKNINETNETLDEINSLIQNCNNSSDLINLNGLKSNLIKALETYNTSIKLYKNQQEEQENNTTHVEYRSNYKNQGEKEKEYLALIDNLKVRRVKKVQGLLKCQEYIFAKMLMSLN